MRDLTVLADYFVIASGTSSTHVKSLAEEVEFQFRKRASQPSGTGPSTPRTGLSWIMPTSSSMCSAPTRGTITIWTICGPTANDAHGFHRGIRRRAARNLQIFLDVTYKMKYDFKAIEKKVAGHLGCGEYLCGQAGFFAAQVLCAGGVPVPLRPGPARGPSAQLHRAGHVARKKRLCGYNVLYPMGWDAFGLPTENYAMKNHIHPEVVTANNVARFKKPAEEPGPLLRLDAGDQHHRPQLLQVDPVDLPAAV